MTTLNCCPCGKHMKKWREMFKLDGIFHDNCSDKCGLTRRDTKKNPNALMDHINKKKELSAVSSQSSFDFHHHEVSQEWLGILHEWERLRQFHSLGQWRHAPHPTNNSTTFLKNPLQNIWPNLSCSVLALESHNVLPSTAGI